MTAASLDEAYFDRLYRRHPDPWGFATQAYEAHKYALTLAALPRSDYDHGLEIGCSVGVLTAQLANRCRRLQAVDLCRRALLGAYQRLGNHPRVQLTASGMPHGLPEGPFDLVLISEVGYYLNAPDLCAAREAILTRLRPGGHLLLVHWTPTATDYPLAGDRVHELFLARCGGGLRHSRGERQALFRWDLLIRDETMALPLA